MTDVNTQVAEPSPQPEAIDLHAMNAEQRQTWRDTGKFPEKVQPAEAADPSKATDPPKEVDSEGQPKSAADPEPAKQQEKKGHQPKPDAEKRISELTAKIKDLEERERSREADTKPPARTIAAVPQKPTRADVDAQGQPKYQTEDDFTEAIADWKADQKLAAYAQQQFTRAMVEEIRARYPNAMDVLIPAAEALAKPGEVDPTVFRLVNNSLAGFHLLYALAGDKAEFQNFLTEAKSNPDQAMRRVVLIEKMVIEELEKGNEAKELSTKERNSDGTFKAADPEKKQDPPAPPETKTAKPLSEVGGRGTPGDDSAASAVKAGDYRAAKAEFERRALASVK